MQQEKGLVISIILREAILVILFSGGPSITMTMTFWKLRSCNAQGMHKAIIRTYWIFTLVLLNFESFRFWKINYLLLLLIYFHFLYPSIIFFQFLFSFRFTLCFLFHSVLIVHLYNTRFCVTVTHTHMMSWAPAFLPVAKISSSGIYNYLPQILYLLVTPHIRFIPNLLLHNSSHITGISD